MTKLKHIAQAWNKAMTAAMPTLGTCLMVLKLAHEWHVLASSCPI